MKKPKVYFAKSNLCNPERIAEIRLTLSALDIELVEFKGGVYDNKELLRCGYLLVCPYEDDVECDGTFVGKGLYRQISDFNDLRKTLVILPGNNKQILVKGIEEMDIENEDDWKRTYATISFTEESSKWLTYIFKVKHESVFKDPYDLINNKNKYLLLIK